MALKGLRALGRRSGGADGRAGQTTGAAQERRNWANSTNTSASILRWGHDTAIVLVNTALQSIPLYEWTACKATEAEDAPWIRASPCIKANECAVVVVQRIVVLLKELHKGVLYR